MADKNKILKEYIKRVRSHFFEAISFGKEEYYWIVLSDSFNVLDEYAKHKYYVKDIGEQINQFSAHHNSNFNEELMKVDFMLGEGMVDLLSIDVSKYMPGNVKPQEAVIHDPHSLENIMIVIYHLNENKDKKEIEHDDTYKKLIKSSAKVLYSIINEYIGKEIFGS